MQAMGKSPSSGKKAEDVRSRSVGGSMQRYHNLTDTRSFASNASATRGKWHTVLNAGLVTAAFVFITAVTLGLFP